MKLVVNSITLSLNEITQTDGQTSGIFQQVDRNDVDNEYASKQIVNIIKKHNNSSVPTKGAFKMMPNDLIGRKEEGYRKNSNPTPKTKKIENYIQ